MTFSRPETLIWLLALLPLVAFAVWAVGLAARRRRRLLGAQAVRLSPGFSRGRRLLRDGLGILGTAFVLLALSGPLLGTWLREVVQRGVDVMIVLDTSRSMLAQDLAPNRLERAKREVRGILDRLAGDRIGLVTFAGDARRLCPLTHDATTVRMFLDDIDTMTNAVGGTAIGEGLELALDSFDDTQPTAAVIILLTDGEDLTSDPPPSEVAFQARAREIPIHVVAFGTAEGGQIPVPGASKTTYVRDGEGNVVVSEPNEPLLEEIAGIGNGAFLSADPDRTAFPLDEIFNKRIAVMDGVERAARNREEGIDRFQWAVALALLCLGTRMILRDEVGP